MGRILEEQKNYSDRKHQDFLEEILNRIEKALALKEQGKEKESEEIVEEVKVWLDSKIERFEQDMKSDASVPVERSLFPKFGEFVAEGDKVRGDSNGI